MSKKPKIFIACDTSNVNQVKKIISHTKNDKLKIIPKFGLQFFYSRNGRQFLRNIKIDFWLDIKISDIPQTAFSAIESLKDLKKLSKNGIIYSSQMYKNGPNKYWYE